MPGLECYFGYFEPTSRLIELNLPFFPVFFFFKKKLIEWEERFHLGFRSLANSSCLFKIYVHDANVS